VTVKSSSRHRSSTSSTIRKSAYTRELLHARPLVGRAGPAPAPVAAPVLLRVDGLDVRFAVTTVAGMAIGRSTVHAVKDLSFEVRRGHHTGAGR